MSEQFSYKEIQDMGAKICRKYFDDTDEENGYCSKCPFEQSPCITKNGELMCIYAEGTFVDFMNRIEPMVHMIIEEAADGNDRNEENKNAADEHI